jgi:hypothetical protein
VKNTKVTYNPNGLKRSQNVSPKPPVPKNDLTKDNRTVERVQHHYFKISKRD